MNHNKQACTLKPARVTHDQCLICTVISVCECRDRRGRKLPGCGWSRPQARASWWRLGVVSGGLFLCGLLHRLGLRLAEGKKGEGEESLMAGLTTTKETLQKRKSYWSVCVCTSVLTVAGFLVVFAVLLRLGVFSATSSSECSVLVSDWSELCWDDASSTSEVAVSKRAAGLRKKKNNWWSVTKDAAL